MTGRRLAGGLLTFAGAAGLTACVLSAFTGMRDVMRDDGGSCGSSGTFVSVHQCSTADMRLLMVGIMGGLLVTAVYTAGTAMLGRPVALAGLLAWTALFGALGWNFIDMGQHTAGEQAWLFTGGAFWVMALVGLVIFVLSLGRDLRDSGRPDPALAGMQPLVVAAVIPGVPAPVPPTGWAGGWPPPGGVPWTGPGPVVTDPVARRAGWLHLVAWLTASVAGAGAGFILGASLVTLLR